mmetsp:Transcript_71056/g.199606  ORF Transcript_71056/g.199606 Transcript_71056/m.199606 type:complete len:226 (-) Transcript_71056:1375-2052(-)
MISERWETNAPPWPKLEVVDVSLGGLHRVRSFPPGALSSLAMSRMLKEVDITGCEGVNNQDLLNLAACCSGTLEAFTGRACTFGGDGVACLALCKRLSLLDISACFGVTSQDSPPPARLYCLKAAPLRILRAADCRFMHGTFAELDLHCPTLKVLDVKYQRLVDSPAPHMSAQSRDLAPTSVIELDTRHNWLAQGGVWNPNQLVSRDGKRRGKPVPEVIGWCVTW